MVRAFEAAVPIRRFRGHGCGKGRAGVPGQAIGHGGAGARCADGHGPTSQAGGRPPRGVSRPAHKAPCRSIGPKEGRHLSSDAEGLHFPIICQFRRGRIPPKYHRSTPVGVTSVKLETLVSREFRRIGAIHSHIPSHTLLRLWWAVLDSSGNIRPRGRLLCAP